MVKKLNLKKLQEDAQNDYLKDQAKKKAIVEKSVKSIRSFYSKVSDGAINMDLS